MAKVATYFTALILTNYGLGYIWGIFFTNASGHPGEAQHVHCSVMGSQRQTPEGQAPGTDVIKQNFGAKPNFPNANFPYVYRPGFTEICYLFLYKGQKCSNEWHYTKIYGSLPPDIYRPEKHGPNLLHRTGPSSRSGTSHLFKTVCHVVSRNESRPQRHSRNPEARAVYQVPTLNFKMKVYSTVVSTGREAGRRGVDLAHAFTKKIKNGKGTRLVRSLLSLGK
jgi:hypothetical protein